MQSASRISTCRMITPFSSSAFHGLKLASWSSVVSTISSPGFQFAPNRPRHARTSAWSCSAQTPLPLFAVEKIRHCRARRRNHLVVALAGKERSAIIRIRAHSNSSESRASPAWAPAFPPGHPETRQAAHSPVRCSEGNCARTQAISSGLLVDNVAPGPLTFCSSFLHASFSYTSRSVNPRVRINL